MLIEYFKFVSLVFEKATLILKLVTVFSLKGLCFLNRKLGQDYFKEHGKSIILDVLFQSLY